MNYFNLIIFFLTLSATLSVKSGLSTVNNKSGLYFKIALTVLLILLLLILNKFNITLVNPKKVISFKS